MKKETYSKALAPKTIHDILLLRLNNRCSYRRNFTIRKNKTLCRRHIKTRLANNEVSLLAQNSVENIKCQNKYN